MKRRPAAKPVNLLATTVGGLVWAGALAASAATSPVAAAAVATPVAVVASVSTTRAVSRHPRTRRPSTVAIVAATFLTVLLPAAAIGGFAALWGAAGVVAATATAVSFFLIRSGRKSALLFAMIAPGVAAASVVLASVQSWNLALTFVGMVCAYDVGCWVYGSRQGIGGWLGVAGGSVTVAAVGLFVAAVFVPPFSGSRPWVVFGLGGILCPLGVLAAAKTTREESLPALRRIDSLVLAGPVWVAATSLVLHR